MAQQPTLTVRPRLDTSGISEGLRRIAAELTAAADRIDAAANDPEETS